jgi:integrase
MSLSDLKCRRAKARTKNYKLADERGLFLLVRAGSPGSDPNKSFAARYRFNGRDKTVGLGRYGKSGVTLSEAREEWDRMRALLRKNIDPAAHRRQQRVEAQARQGNTFRAVASEWISKKRNKWDAAHAERVDRSLSLNLYPDIGDRPISKIEPPELLVVLGKIESRGSHEIRQRVQQRASAVFRYGIATGKCLRDPAADLRGAFTAPKAQHYAALTEKEFPDFLRKIANYEGTITRLALRLLTLTAVRTTELRAADWSEFDLDGAEWRVPAERMKMREPHIVPLSKQAITALRELQTYSGNTGFAFPNINDSAKCMSNNAMLFAIHKLGYKGKMTGHGARSVFSTILHEQGFPHAVIERQLAHRERNKVAAAYDRSEHLAARVKLMQHWADFLDGLAAGAKVTPIRRAARR